MNKILRSISVSFIAFIMCLSIFTPKSSAATESMRVQLYRMANVVYDTDTKIKGFKQNGWKYVALKHTSKGFDGAVYKKKSSTYSGKNDYCFAFRGTKGGKDITKADISEVTFGLHTSQVPDSINWVKSIISKNKNDIGKVYFTGHSLGGYLAAWSQAEIVDGKITLPKGKGSSYTRTFNAPGITPIVLSSQPSKIAPIQMKNASDLLEKYNNYIKNYAISRNVYNARTGTYSMQTVDPVFAWGNTLGKIVKAKVKNNTLYTNNFSYHPRTRWNEILNTSNFPD